MLTATTNRVRTRSLLVATRGLCACLAASAALVVHAAPQPQESSGKWRLLNRAEGRDIASVARGQDEPVPDAQDCSHLVHEIYARAGYEYPYANSYDLYAGNEHFARVKNPQPGDLVVWRGHVGIVLNPKHHSFYSQVSSGPDAQDYTGAYWRSRGRPRFYRFIVEDSAIVATAKMRSRSLQKAQTLSSKTAINRDAEKESRNAKLAPQDAAERSPIPAVARATAPAEAGPTNDVPPIIVIASGPKSPTKDEVAAGITELSRSLGAALRTDEPLKVQIPVVIYERVAVERVRIKGDSGSADVRVESGVLLTNEGADFKPRREKVRWELRRTETGWIAVAPAERAYVPRDVAVRIFAAQLAHLAESDAAAAHDESVLGQEARLANLLSALLQN